VSAIHQFVPTITRRDAIGHHVLELRDLLRSLGVASEIYAAEVHADVADAVRPYQEYVTEDDRTALLYHAATISPLASYLTQRPEPTIVDYHNVTPAEFFTGWDAGHAGSLRAARREIGEIVRTADLVIAHSRFSGRDIEGWGHAHPIIAPVLGASFLADPGEPAAPRAARASRERPVEWLFVGRLAPNKRQEQLVKALAIFRRTYGLPAVLHLVGSASPRAYGDAVARLAHDAGVSDVVHFHEDISAEALAKRYRSADVFVSASAHEGYCVPVVEALRFGVPVVARAAGAIPETAGGAAVLVPGAGASRLAVGVHRVVTDGALAAALAAAGRDRAAVLAARERNDYRDALRPMIERLR
jgi:glycosyltransferase involved in cell wall biosynthesis